MAAAQKYTNEQLLLILRVRAYELGRVPTHTEIRPPYTTYVYRFGSWAKAVKLAGLTPRQHGGDARFALVTKPRTQEVASVRAYWLATDPTVQSAGWRHPYARQSVDRTVRSA